MKKDNFTFIDLFAGIGGFRIALESFGGKCVFTSEWDKYAQMTYEANFGEKPAGDITKIKSNKIPPHNVLCAGFPCQAFSVSGKQKGFEDMRGTLFFDIVRIARYHKPEILFLENVKNFAKHDGGKTLQVVRDTLNKIGYDVFCKVLNASHYGAPQSRERIYFACFRKDLKVKDFEFPKPSMESVKLKDFLQSNSEAQKQIINRKDIRFFDNVPKLAKSNLFGNGLLEPIQIGTINKGGQGERIYSIDGHAITISAYGGGVASKTGAYLVDNTIRKLTPRECARLFGFQENFKIIVPNTQAYKQFGNSVVILVLKSVWQEVLKQINGGPRPSGKHWTETPRSLALKNVSSYAIQHQYAKN